MKGRLIVGMMVVAAFAMWPIAHAGAVESPLAGGLASNPVSAAIGSRDSGAKIMLAGHPGKYDEQGYYDGSYNKRYSKNHGYRGKFFRSGYRTYFRECYGVSETGGLPPGLQKHLERTGRLPAGLERHLARNGQLPPGLEKKMVPVNDCVRRHIGPLPRGTQLYLLGRDAYLVNQSARQVIDILHNVFSGR